MAHKNPTLIKMYENIHTENKYGRGGHKFAWYVDALIQELNAKSLLDYGCGQTNMHAHLKNKNIDFHRYDPAVPEISEINIDRVDLLSCTDVLEHIPPEDVTDFLNHMKQYSDRVFLNICTRPASTILPDGRNAHLSVFTPDEWLTRVREVFPNAVVIPKPYNQSCIVLSWPAESYKAFDRHAKMKKIQRAIVKPVRTFFKSFKSKKTA